MATCSSVLAWKCPNRGGWWATVHGIAKESDMADYRHTYTTEMTSGERNIQSLAIGLISYY